MDYSVVHRTTYHYAAPVAMSQLLGHLRPRATVRQRVASFALEVEPVPAVLVERTDYYGNQAVFMSVEGPHEKLTATARSRVTVERLPPGDLQLSPSWEAAREECAQDVFTSDSGAGEYLFDSPHIARQQVYAEYARRFFAPGRPLLAAFEAYIAGIYQDFQFDARATTTATPLDEVFRHRRGVCQDFAHLAIAGLRSLGLPARYVSGYLETIPPPGRARLIGADASHAWVGLWCPGQGWIDADPTNNTWVTDRHITVAWGRDFSDVSPLRGVLLGGGKQSLQVNVDVQRLDPQIELGNLPVLTTAAVAPPLISW